MAEPHVIIIGCGFGGLAATRALARAPVRITLLDRTNHHAFQPLLYQVATAGLAAPAIATPIRFLLRKQRNVTPLMAEVRAIDITQRRVQLDDDSTLAYDFLIVATGTTHSYFGHDEWAPFAPGLKTLQDAQEIRRHLLLGFEYAEREPEIAASAGWLTFAVVGAGPTGVELSGTVAEIARHTLPEEFRRIDSRRTRVVLIEAGDRVLSAFPPALSTKAMVQLQRLGVEVRLRCPVTNIDALGVSFADGTRLAARTVVWAAGVAASPLGRALGVTLDRAGRVEVLPTLDVPDHPEVFVIGDLASIAIAGKPVPGVAAAAKQMGRCAADNILASLAQRARRPFRYRDYGMLATIGRNAAVGVVGPVEISGHVAWLFWLLVHLWYLIGFRNRVIVLFDWAWAYISFQRSARIFSPRS
jgi:NADH dehydrogenase